MSISQPTSGNGPTPSPVVLPPNVFIFSPVDARAAEALLNSRIFTRLAVSAHTEPTKLSEALRSTAALNETFCLSFRNSILVFTGNRADNPDDEMDFHHEKFRLVALALKEFDISLDVAGCVFDALDILQAGFQLDKLSDGAVMVIDLMSQEDDDDESSSGGEEELFRS
ncbi:hypothetical protein BP6252_09591 [Coleophoma cylindrospora]|uniref:Uncharacterized protein n=1 Tax=Coleophoma cylindrospora TaxID=1849047 RepID=A0A3D8QVV9_9HELO|nr:hypothetical protein BP6252_09591 [Coleophoma cylindrospora]